MKSYGESKKDEESLELEISNLNINSTSEDKGFAEETSLGEQENKGSQEFGTAILKTSDERILALEEGIKILSEMTKRSSEEHDSSKPVSYTHLTLPTIYSV